MEEEETPSAPSSPTPSAITQNIAAEISVLEKEFQIDETRFQKEFHSKKNELKRIWFLSNFLEIKDEIREKYYVFCNDYKIQIKFFDWFETFYAHTHKIEYPLKKTKTK